MEMLWRLLDITCLTFHLGHSFFLFLLVSQYPFVLSVLCSLQLILGTCFSTFMDSLDSIISLEALNTMYMLIPSLIHCLVWTSGSYPYFSIYKIHQNWDVEFPTEPSLSPVLLIFSHGNATITLSQVKTMSYLSYTPYNSVGPSKGGDCLSPPFLLLPQS